MKSTHFVLLILLASILSACQSQAAPTISPNIASSTANFIPTQIVKPSLAVSNTQQPTNPFSTAAPASTSETSAPTIHSSSSNPNAGNLIEVRDQVIANNSLIIDTVTAAQAGWIILYFDKQGQPGELITYVPVSAGKSNQIAIPLSNLKNPIIQINSISSRQLLVMLAAGNPAPGNPVRDNNKLVMASFSTLAH